jgi:hypothetical protein
MMHSKRVLHVLHGLLVTLFLVCPLRGYGAVNLDILVNFEEPLNGRNITGIGLVRGWAVAPIAIETVELYIDGMLSHIIPYGGTRNDVAAVYPMLPNSNLSGFAMAFNFNNLNPGQHTFMVRAIDENGDHRDASHTFTSMRFDDETFLMENEVSLDAFQLSPLIVGTPGEAYSADLEWSAASQQFVIRNIASLGPIMVLPLEAPDWLVADRINDDVLLSWADTSTTELGFYVERRFNTLLGGSGSYERIAIVQANQNGYTDTTVDFTPSGLLGSEYEYRVRAFRADQTSTYSNTATVTVPTFMPPLL